jgi:hypothetical protein
MKRLTVALLFLLITGLHAQDAGAPPTVFGVTLIKPVSYPECAGIRVNPRLPYAYTAPTAGPCIQLADQMQQGYGKIPTDGTVFLVFPLATQPELAKGGMLGIGLLGGVVQSVGFSTMGTEAQERDYTALVQKFGTPTSVTHPTLQNGYGATFSSTVADWDLVGGFHVHYDAAYQNLTQGSVLVQTAAAAAADKKKAEAPTSQTQL